MCVRFNLGFSILYDILEHLPGISLSILVRINREYACMSGINPVSIMKPIRAGTGLNNDLYRYRGGISSELVIE